MGWGGVIASGLAGALGGAGEGLAQVGIMEQKAEIERMRDERLAELRSKENAQLSKMRTNEHATNAATDIANIGARNAATSAAKASTSATDAATEGEMTYQKAAGTAKAAGEARGKYSFEAAGGIYDPVTKEWAVPPTRPKSDEENELIKARTAEAYAGANAHNARAAAVGKEKADKTDIKLAKGKDDEGNPVTQDMNTGWRQVITAGKPEKKGSDGILGFGKKEGKPAIPSTTSWEEPGTGRVLSESEYRTEFYPQRAAKRGIANSGTGDKPAEKSAPSAAKPAEKVAATKPPAGIPPGSKLSNRKTKDGQPLWQSPDGKLWTE